MFDKAKYTVNEHIKNIHKEGELLEQETKSKFGNSEFPDKPTSFYSLDVITSVGCRVKSARGTQFRVWANRVLKDYLTKGYAINEKRLQEQSRQLEELRQTVKLLGNVISTHELTSDEANGLLKVVTDYTYALDVLDQYDHQVLEIEDTTLKEFFQVTYDEAKIAIKGLRDKFGAARCSEMKKMNPFKAHWQLYIKPLVDNFYIPVLKRKQQICCTLL